MNVLDPRGKSQLVALTVESIYLTDFNFKKICHGNGKQEIKSLLDLLPGSPQWLGNL